MYTNRSLIYVRTVDELTVLWNEELPVTHVIGDLSDRRWQDVLAAKRTRKMVLLSWDAVDVIFAPGDAWGEKKFTTAQRKTVAGKVELITRLLSYQQNQNHPVLVRILKKYSDVSFLDLSYDFKVDWFQ